MNLLSGIAAGSGVAHVLAAFVIWLAGGRVRTRLETLPRHRLLGAVLAAAAVGWAAWNMYAGDLGRFNALKPWLAVAAPLLWAGILYYMPELLAARMAGALLLLAANPALRAARFHESAWSLTIPAVAYVWIFLGMAWMLGPWRMRRSATWLLATPLRIRLTGAVAFLVGLALLWTAKKVA